ncbi:aconitate hydratase AcnA [Cutibacterium avidum]|uniref:aconitate hydratase AcnA n=1 Tax=Cutibacterium avidum TaxID=33010 RepID=UPI0007640731|nr:aconitate hydratase AcnA [Cutibacterium avidum]KXA66517.1 aconitate hydratase 1 [Cutibacterium avidum]MCO6659484.1 aconitate hydratase AcnA [Cutibacterium avidum]MCT1416000.1 aconitate hydratase AcnA [Cutibacterium avidum]MCX8466329.1 aconitate hydratase AcnA [Cutibacterium avidum]MCX8468759.1 aconitate hydratase AcnA [Cutibacterium avidum]
MSVNSFDARRTLDVDGQSYEIYDVTKVDGSDSLPYSLKVLLENLLRTEDGANITAEQITDLGHWDADAQPSKEIQFTPARVIMQDFTGVPCIVDLATMREAVTDLGGDPSKVNPLSPAEMVIDHSVIVERFGTPEAFEQNKDIEYQRNRERYQFLRWGQAAFENFRVVPPGTGIVHQVNIEHLARVTFVHDEDGKKVAYPDTCVGTDSHTTMVNGLGVVGWGVGGIEAEAAMLGQPVSMLVPRVVGFKLSGELPDGVTATDLVLTITQMLREHKVVGKFVEFYGPGVAAVPLANRATLGNMSPEYGSTIAVFPIDDVTLDYLRLTGRDESQVKLVEAYANAQGMWHDPDREPRYSEYMELDLSTVKPSIAGPKRPQDRILVSEAKETFEKTVPDYTTNPGAAIPVSLADGRSFELRNGAVTVAAITSCTNTSNPSVMIAAGLVAKKAHELGLSPKPWVKTSLAPGSQVVTDYFERAGLSEHLAAMGFDLVGYGCTTCIGNTGPLIPEVSAAINENDLAVTAVLSGNRNFEGRISPDVKMNYLASPPLVVIYSIAGTMDIDLNNDVLATTPDGREVRLADLWPSTKEIEEIVGSSISAEMYSERYADVFDGGPRWKELETPEGETFSWDPASTYVRKLPIFDGMKAEPDPVGDITDARVLLKLGDSVTTDHISPAGNIKTDSPAGQWLAGNGVERRDFNSYGSRRGNHEVMMRGTFANIRLRNQLAPGTEGGFTRDFTKVDGPVTTVYDASVSYREQGIPLVVLGGKEYGSGSSRDWAAKGTQLLGVKAVITESYERIHRSNLIGMGVLPLQFPEGESADSLGLTGEETFEITGVDKINEMIPETVHVKAVNGEKDVEFDAVVRIDTPGERSYYLNGGILQYVLRNMARN